MSGFMTHSMSPQGMYHPCWLFQNTCTTVELQTFYALNVELSLLVVCHEVYLMSVLDVMNY